jgi:hypothetical protein
MNSYFFITIRNPYAQIEGLLHRKWPFNEYGPQTTPSAPSTPTTAAEFWVRAARYQIHNLRHLKNTLFFTYEELTDNTDQVVKKIINFLPNIGSVDTGIRFTAQNVTGRPIVKGLKNFNKKKIDKLTEAEIEEINMVLGQHQDVLSAFKYNLIQ